VFSNDPEVIAATVSYITRVAPFFFLFGIGMTLSFASQGAGRMWPPFNAGVARMIVATTGGYTAVEVLGGGLAEIFVAIAGGMITFGGLIAAPLVIRPWRARRGTVAA
jgi:Na+-driven multidrug efflux pump